MSGSYRKGVDWNIVSQQAYFVGDDKNLEIVSKSGNSVQKYTHPLKLYTVAVSRDSTYAVTGG